MVATLIVSAYPHLNFLYSAVTMPMRIDKNVISEDTNDDARARHAVEVGLVDAGDAVKTNRHVVVELEPEVCGLLDSLDCLAQLEHSAGAGEAGRHLDNNLAVDVGLRQGLGGVNLVCLEVVGGNDGAEQANGGGGEGGGVSLSVIVALTLTIAARLVACLHLDGPICGLGKLEDPLRAEHLHPLLALDDVSHLVLLDLARDLVPHHLLDKRPVQ